VRRSKTDPDGHGQVVDVAHGRHALTDPVAALPELAQEPGVSEEVRLRLTQDYEEHLALAQAKSSRSSAPEHSRLDEIETMLDEQDERDVSSEGRPVQLEENGPLARNEEYTRLRVAMLDRKRETLLRLRRDSTIDDSVALRIQTRLDLEELRLTGVEPLD
jgi:hypothetical protein